MLLLGDQERQSRISIQKSHVVETKGEHRAKEPEIILAQDRVYARNENPSQQSCLGRKESPTPASSQHYKRGIVFLVRNHYSII